MRALIYKRVSDDRAQGRSPAEQETEARALCQREGWTVVGVVGDSVGASRHSRGERSGWQQVRRLLASGEVDVLVTWEASRAHRDLHAYAELRDLCEQHKVLWSYSGRTHDLSDKDDRFKTGLDALLAEREADETSHRVRRATRANAVAGRPHGRRLYGYRRVYDPTTGQLLGQEPHPDEAPLVRRVFADFDSGLGCRSIAAALNAEGARTVLGKPWTDARLRQMLRNPGYVGRRVHYGEVTADGGWEPLVEVKVFERVNARLDAQSDRYARSTWNARLLTAVARCGVCGGKMTVSHFATRRSYRCKDKSCVTRDETRLDAAVTAVLLERLSRVDGEPGEAPEIGAARALIAELEARLADAVGEFTAGNLSASVLARIEAVLVPQVKEARRVVRRAMARGVDVPSGSLVDWWESLGAEQRRTVVGVFVEAVIVRPTGRGKRPLDPSAIEIVWR